ncbi:acyl-CoA thioesterase [Cohnella nanjingensis]|uniref:Acyl-CoA thioesterase n=1 Tax=Cohnella nanjingensis TaxID=1387779 RepID=A0A7X0RNZ7_9BACL|nr:thioesterase family protein [Cohnella nanjingensis]MBB6671043.1 acyl-CoA thioesterase [Cohnella nanjingensis]
MSSAWHLHPLRVRYQETDKMGVVYHANYVNWFEIGRTEWVRQAGYTYREIETRGLLLPVVNLEASFEQPALYDDWVTICTRVTEMTPLRVRFESRVVRGDRTQERDAPLTGDEPPGETLVKGGTRHVWVNAAWKPVRLDREAPDVWQAMRQLTEGRTGPA